MDSNCAAFQVAAYIGFEFDVHRGSGPKIFELAFQHADMTRSISAHEKVTNYLMEARMEANGRFDLLRSVSLQGDLETKSMKRKGVTNDCIGDDNSHRYDTVLITSLKRRVTRRKNLNATSFQSPQFTLTPIQAPLSVQPHLPRVVNLSDSDSIEEFSIPENPAPVDVSTWASTFFGFFTFHQVLQRWMCHKKHHLRLGCLLVQTVPPGGCCK